MAELVDAPDLGSGVPRTCRFESCSRYVSLFEEVRRPATFSRVGPFGPWLLFWLLFFQGAGAREFVSFHSETLENRDEEVPERAKSRSFCA